MEGNEKLKVYAVRLRLSQIEFLKGQSNAAEWIREAIDRSMAEEAGASKVILLYKQIRMIEDKIDKLSRSPDYLNAQERLRATRYYQCKTVWQPYIDGLKPIEHENAKVTCFGGEWGFNSKWHPDLHESYVEVSHSPDRETCIRRAREELKRKLEQLKDEGDYHAWENVVEAYQREMNRLRLERDNLKKTVSSVSEVKNV